MYFLRTYLAVLLLLGLSPYECESQSSSTSATVVTLQSPLALGSGVFRAAVRLHETIYALHSGLPGVLMYDSTGVLQGTLTDARSVYDELLPLGEHLLAIGLSTGRVSVIAPAGSRASTVRTFNIKEELSAACVLRDRLALYSWREGGTLLIVDTLGHTERRIPVRLDGDSSRTMSSLEFGTRLLHPRLACAAATGTVILLPEHITTMFAWSAADGRPLWAVDRQGFAPMEAYYQGRSFVRSIPPSGYDALVAVQARGPTCIAVQYAHKTALPTVRRIGSLVTDVVDVRTGLRARRITGEPVVIGQAGEYVTTLATPETAQATIGRTPEWAQSC